MVIPRFRLVCLQISTRDSQQTGSTLGLEFIAPASMPHVRGLAAIGRPRAVSKAQMGLEDAQDGQRISSLSSASMSASGQRLGNWLTFAIEVGQKST